MDTIKCQVEATLLTLGNRKGHEEEKMYERGDILTIPKKLAEELGTSVVILESTEEGTGRVKEPEKKGTKKGKSI